MRKERNVNKIQNLVESEGSAVSQQLMVLRAKNIVTGTKDGNRVIYSLRDPMIIELLSVTRQIFNNYLVDTMTLLDTINNEESKTEQS